MSRRADLGTALVWFVLGAAVAVASWRMDRLSHLDVSPWSVPGLTPGAIGVLMMLFAAVLGWRAWRGGAAPPPRAAVDAGAAGSDRSAVGSDGPAGTSAAVAGPAAPGDRHGPAPVAGEGRRTLVAAALCLLFAGATLGRGMPFVFEGAVFVFVFTSVFSWRTWRDEGRLGRGLAQTAVVAVLSALLIAWLFESVFLVRLP